MRKSFAIGAFVVVIAIITFAAISANQSQSDTQKNNTPEKSQESKLALAPAFSLKDYNGKTVSLSDFLGTPVIVNSWATWCPFCVDELPDFALLQEEFQGQVVILAINRAEPMSVVRDYLETELGISRDLLFLLDPADSFYSEIGGFSMPETIFVDRNGRIAAHKKGIMTLAEMREKIKLIL